MDIFIAGFLYSLLIFIVIIGLFEITTVLKDILIAIKQVKKYEKTNYRI